MELLQQGKPFYRGNLHCHTTKSDGAWSPEQVIQTYQEMGYDFLAITDHRRVTVPACRMVGSMLVLPGIELDYTLPEEVVHIVGFGMVENILPYLNYELGPQNGVNAIRACGGRKVRLTIYPDLGHNAWDPAYDDPALYAWLLEQKLPSSQNITKDKK